MSQTHIPFIKNLNLEQAVAYFLSLGEKEYRARQLFNWLYERNVESFDEMTNFSKELRACLSRDFILSPLELDEHRVSAVDGTEKYLFRTWDGHYIESVLLRNEGDDEGRLTVCISSQVGCAMGCSFCATASIGYKRNLETAEIIDQLCQIRRLSGLKNNNIVFMGMGEPFLNYDSVLAAADIMNYSFGFHISVRRITISTCGILPGIERFIDEERPYNLAISLNDTEPDKRRKNMPVEKKYPFEEIVRLLDRKFPASRNRLTIEYVMRSDNISTMDARRLKNIFRYGRIKLNLIPVSGMENRPDDKDVERFINDLSIMNIPISVRKSLGADISGACGQLSGKRYNAGKNETTTEEC